MIELEEAIAKIIERPGNSFHESQKIALSIIEEQEKVMPLCHAKLKMIAWDQSKVA